MNGGGHTAQGEEGNFWKWLQTHFLVYPAFEKREKDSPQLPALHPQRSSTYCVTTPTWLPPPPQPTALVKSLIGRLSNALALSSFTFAPELWQICLSQWAIFLIPLSFLTTSCVVSLSCPPNNCRNEAPTCKQFSYKIKLGPIPFYIGAPAWPGSCLLEVDELAQTEANGWKSLTNLSNSCLQGTLFLSPTSALCPLGFLSLLALLLSPSLPKSRGWVH